MEHMIDPDSERQAAMLKEDIKSLRAYPFIYLAASIFPLINRFALVTFLLFFPSISIFYPLGSLKL